MSEFEILYNQYDQVGEAYLAAKKTSETAALQYTNSRKKILDIAGSLKGLQILDAGCGSGIDAETYLKAGVAGVSAFDSSEYMVHVAQQNQPSQLVEFKQGRFESIPFPDASVDIALSFFALHYVFNLDDAWRELHRVLKPGGRFIFIVPHPYNSPQGFYEKKGVTEKGIEVVEMRVYGGAVNICCPRLCLEHYFSPVFASLFHLDVFQETRFSQFTAELTIGVTKLN